MDFVLMSCSAMEVPWLRECDEDAPFTITSTRLATTSGFSNVCCEASSGLFAGLKVRNARGESVF